MELVPGCEPKTLPAHWLLTYQLRHQRRTWTFSLFFYWHLKYRSSSFTFLLGRKDGSVLFNDTLNTFYLRLYGVRHMVKVHSDSKRRNPMMPHWLLFLISSKGSFICIIPQTAFVTPIVEHWLEWEIPQWFHHEGSIRRPIAPWAKCYQRRTLTFFHFHWRLQCNSPSF